MPAVFAASVFPPRVVVQQPSTERRPFAAAIAGSFVGSKGNFLGPRGGMCLECVARVSLVCHPFRAASDFKNSDPVFLLCGDGPCCASCRQEVQGRVEVGGLSSICYRPWIIALRLHADRIVDKSTDELGLYKNTRGLLLFVQ